MKLFKNRLYLIFLVLYVAFFIVFLAKILIEAKQEPVLTQPSEIPSLSQNLLNKVVNNLEKRDKLEDLEKIDLTEIDFGKLEPFRD